MCLKGSRLVLIPVWLILAMIISGAMNEGAAAPILQPSWNRNTSQIEFSEPVGQSFTAEDSTIGKVSLSFDNGMNSEYPILPLTLNLFRGVGDGGPLLASTTFLLEPAKYTR
jgi:hypothetical protein